MQGLGKAFTATVIGLLLFAVPGVDLRAQTGGLAAPGDGGTLVVVSGGAAEVLLIDPVTHRVLGRFPTGPDPRDVALSPDGRFAYVTSYGWRPPVPVPASADGAFGAADLGSAFRGVTVLDLVERRVHAVFQPDDYTSLGGIHVGRDGHRLWITSAAGGIVEMDALTGKVTMLWQTGGGDPSTLVASPDSRRVYVANTGADQVTVVDRVTVVPTFVPTGRGPEGLTLSRDGRELWVANAGDHTLSVFSTRRLEEIATFPSGGAAPTRLRFHPLGHEVWVSHRGSHEVTVLDVASAAVLERIPVEGEPRGLAFSDDGSVAYVSVPSRHRVVMIDVAAREIIGSLDAGPIPMGVAWSGAGRSSFDR